MCADWKLRVDFAWSGVLQLTWGLGWLFYDTGVLNGKEVENHYASVYVSWLAEMA